MSAESYEKSLKEFRKYDKYKHAKDIPNEEIPESYDLRNISGVDYSGKVRDQGGCGSCYSHSFIQVVESRLRQKYGVDKVPDLSI